MKKYFLLLVSGCVGVSLLQAQISERQVKENLIKNLQEQQFTRPDRVEYLVTSQYESKHNGVTHIYLNQIINGLEVFNANSAMHFTKDGKLFLFHNQFINISAQNTIHTNAALSPLDALQKGMAMDGMKTSSALGKTNTELNGKMSWSDPQASSEKMFAKLGYLIKDNQLELVWQVEYYNDKTNDWWTSHVEANTGTILSHTTSTAHCDFSTIYHSGQTGFPNYNFENEVEQNKKAGTGSYKVFPLPLESPSKGPRSLMTNMATANASPYGWHDTDGVAGTEFTITRGNNVWAKEDTLANNGTPNPGFSPDGGVDLIFDYPYNVDSKPRPNMNAAITNLFYVNNVIHDIFFNYGFDEVSGNFQQKNYTNTGKGKDFVYGDALDGAGTSNANFSTPVDGSNGRMQMFLWPTAAATINKTMKINYPLSLPVSYIGPQSQFGGRLTLAGTTGRVILLKDSNASTSYGCGLIANASALNGRIALIDRGGFSCSYILKVKAAQNAGAIAAVIVNNNIGSPFVMTGTDPSIVIPSIMLSQIDGANIKNALLTDSVNATLYDSSEFNLARIYDGDLDNGVIIHEFGHGISTRITGGPDNSNCLKNAEQAGEGWSDFFALALTTKASETSATSRGIGTFVVNQDTDGVGIRAYRYSRNMSINPTTYKAIISNSEVHNVGFVFCCMLYDFYWDMIDRYGFDPDIYNGKGGNNMALQLIMDGLKLQPCSPGFIDSRNAIIKADSINNGGANKDILWRAFARRGLGYTASQGLSSSAKDGIESFDLPPGITGVDHANLENNISMYPNPTHTFINIELFGGNRVMEVQLFDISGKWVQTENFEKTPISNAKLFIGNHEKGWYLVKIMSDGGSIFKKLLID